MVTECRSKQEALNVLNGEIRGFHDGVKRFRKVAESMGKIVAECFHTHDEILSYTIVNYAPLKGGELVMLHMLPLRGLHTIGRLTHALPHEYA